MSAAGDLSSPRPDLLDATRTTSHSSVKLTKAPPLENRIFDAPIEFAKEHDVLHEVGLPNLDPEFDLVAAAEEGKYDGLATYAKWSKPTEAYFGRSRKPARELAKQFGGLSDEQLREMIGLYHVTSFRRPFASQPGSFPTPQHIVNQMFESLSMAKQSFRRPSLPGHVASQP